ncbi:MAG: glycosyltransferase family 4 protein [Deltaproteobacteria bacterium]|nr:glycosyltransferase family 4 protein [Deltaproteobacteria bacterium]
MFISHDVGLMGAERCLLDLLKGLDRNKITPFFLASREGPLTEEIRKLDVDVHIAPVDHWIPYSSRWGRWHLLNFIKKLPSRVGNIARLVKENNIDIVYSNTVTCIDGALAALWTRRKHIWHVHENVKNNIDLKPYISAHAVPTIISFLSGHIILNSQYLQNYFCRRHASCSVVYNGVALENYQALPKHSLHQELNVPPKTKFVAIVGSISELKGHRSFIQAAKHVADRYKDVSFIIVGAGKKTLISDLKDIAGTLHLEHKLHFLGHRNEINHIMASIDVLVLASLQESFGRVLIEAMACGKPVVATRCGGPEEIVVDGETGFLVPIGDSKEMADAILKLLSNEDLCKEFGKQGRERCEQNFSLNSYIKKIESIITNKA